MVVTGVLIKMIDQKVYSPSDLDGTPMASMSSWTNRVVEHNSVNQDSSVGLSEGVFGAGDHAAFCGTGEITGTLLGAEFLGGGAQEALSASRAALSMSTARASVSSNPSALASGSVLSTFTTGTTGVVVMRACHTPIVARLERA